MALSALLDILVILVAAKVAAEVSERVGLPAVVGEIVAGILIGPSLLGLVGNSDVLSVLAELGVILLLLDVGLEMDLRELGAVGRAALTVALIGVIVPFATGTGVGFLLGFGTNEAIFVGAALTATSVGISARVFGDLRALASVEARTVLGAAVADDVLGLIILTVVVRLTDSGSVQVGEVIEVLVVAVVFLAASLAIGVRVVPPLFDAIGRISRSAGTLVALALAFALAVAELADAAKLAPIVGAFVAGVTLARSRSSDRIRSDLAPVGHLFIPVFFLQIGIDAEVERFFDTKVLGMAAALLAVAVIGKVVAAAGLLGAPGDRLLVGLGMIPRGEVGLIFATIGLQQGVFGDDVYATLLIVVLVTTLVTPPLLRLRLIRLRTRPTSTDGEDGPARVAIRSGEVSYAGAPDPQAAFLLALEASVHIEERRPTAELLDLLAGLPEQELEWTEPTRAAFLEMLERGAGPRSWRFLYITGVLRRAIPELDEAIATHVADPFDLDPLGSMRWPRLARLVDQGTDGSEHPERLVLAALAVDATDGDLPQAQQLAGKMAGRIGLGAEAAAGASELAGDAGLLLGTSRRSDAFGEEAVVQLAAHLTSAERVRDLHRITLAVHPVEGDAASGHRHAGRSRGRRPDLAPPNGGVGIDRPPPRAGHGRGRRSRRARRHRDGATGLRPDAVRDLPRTAGPAVLARSPGRSGPGPRAPRRSGPLDDRDRRPRPGRAARPPGPGPRRGRHRRARGHRRDLAGGHGAVGLPRAVVRPTGGHPPARHADRRPRPPVAHPSRAGRHGALRRRRVALAHPLHDGGAGSLRPAGAGLRRVRRRRSQRPRGTDRDLRRRGGRPVRADRAPRTEGHRRHQGGGPPGAPGGRARPQPQEAPPTGLKDR